MAFSTNVITIYHPSGSSMQILEGDLDRWVAQGWGATQFSPSSGGGGIATSVGSAPSGGGSNPTIAPPPPPGQPMAGSVGVPPPTAEQTAAQVAAGFAPGQGATVGAAGTTTELSDAEKEAQNISNTDPSILPQVIRDDDEFKSLDLQTQKLIAFAYKMHQQNDVLQKIKMRAALKQATALADPIFKQKLLDLQDEANRSITELLARSKAQVEKMQTEIANLQAAGKLADARDLQVTLDNAQRESSSREAEVGATIARLQERIKGIQTDLEYHKNELTIEQQQTLNQLGNKYKEDLKVTQQNAVDAGMGFSSIRAEAEERLAQQSQDIVESTKRQTSRQIREQETTSEQQKAELDFAQAETQRKAEEARIANARKVEELIGSEEAIKQGILTPDLKSLNLKGSIAEQKTKREQEAAARQADIDELKRQTDAEEAARKAKKLEDERLLEIQKNQEIAATAGNIADTI